MALIVDPTYGGPGSGMGRGPMIDDGTGTPDAPVVLPELPQYAALANQAAGLSGDTATADYIRALASGSLGGAADTTAAFARLIEEGRLRDVAAGTTGTGGSTGVGGGGGGATTVVDPVFGGKREDARNTIKAVLATYKLESLSTFLYDLYASGKVDINNPDAIIYAIRDQDAYKTRFAANKARNDKGLSELDPGSYIALEDNYRRLMQSNGLPSGFYDQTDDFTKLIEGDVSAQELQDRVQNGFRAVQDADPEVKRQMQELYGVNEAGLAAYFLDPTKAAPILTRQAEAAKISARAKGLANVQLTALTAEELAARGITQAEAEAGFTKLGLQQGLYTEMAGEQGLTQQQKVGAALGTDINAQTILEQRKSSRLSPFKGGGKFTSTTGQTSGTTESGLNVAQ